MKTRILLLMAASMLVAADKPKSDVAAKELKKLQGTWSIASAESNGEQLAGESLKEAPRKLVIKGNKYTLEIKGNTDTGTFVVRANKRPLALDSTGDDGQSHKAVFEVKGGTLKICFDASGGERPTKLSTAGHPEWVLLVFKQVKEKK